jgi:hypothetical protein
MKITINVVTVEMKMVLKITSREIELYAQKIEKFLNYEDESTRVLWALEDRVRLSGLQSLNKPEQIYYSINEFNCFIWNEGIPAYLESGNELLFSKVSEGFALLEEPAWIKGYERISEKFAIDPEFSDEDTWDFLDSPFIDDNQSLPAAIDEYAERHGLLQGLDNNIEYR